MKRITITSIATLLAIYLAACGSSQTGDQGNKKVSASPDVAQNNNRPATDAKGANQPVQGVQQPATETNQRAANTQGVNRQGKSDRRSTTGRRQTRRPRGKELGSRAIETRADYGAYGCVPLRCGGLVQAIELRDVAGLSIRVMRPSENIEVVTVQVNGNVNGPSTRPTYVDGVKYTSDWSPARRIYVAAPDRQECPTRYGVQVEPVVQ